MVATIHRLRTAPVFTIDVATDGKREAGTFPVGDGHGTVISRVATAIVEPAFLSGGSAGDSRLIAIGNLGDNLLARALDGAFSLRCRAVAEHGGWKLIEIIE